MRSLATLRETFTDTEKVAFVAAIANLISTSPTNVRVISVTNVLATSGRRRLMQTVVGVDVEFVVDVLNDAVASSVGSQLDSLAATDSASLVAEFKAQGLTSTTGVTLTSGSTMSSAPPSSVQPITCAENERLQNNTCVSKFCGAYERVQNNTCVACRPGPSTPRATTPWEPTPCATRGTAHSTTTSSIGRASSAGGAHEPGGDDESGDDTECPRVRLGRWGRVRRGSLFTAVAVALVTAILDSRRWENNIPLS